MIKRANFTYILSQKYKYVHFYEVVKRKKKLDRANLHGKANQRMIKDNLWFLSFSGERNSESQHTGAIREEGEKAATRFSYIYAWLGNKLPSWF